MGHAAEVPTVARQITMIVEATVLVIYFGSTGSGTEASRSQPSCSSVID